VRAMQKATKAESQTAGVETSLLSNTCQNLDKGIAPSLENA
jgi:hypothetical protein